MPFSNQCCSVGPFKILFRQYRPICNTDSLGYNLDTPALEAQFFVIALTKISTRLSKVSRGSVPMHSRIWKDNMNSKIVIAAAAVAMAGLAHPAYSAPKAQQLGSVHFETSCTPAAQKIFDLGMLYQHSFWYSASKRTFEDALKADPQCAIAYWGIALSHLYNPHSPPPPDALSLGLEAAKKGQALGAKTQRERDYIEAIAAMYMDYDKVDHRTRVQNYLKAEEQVALRYPKDDEAQIAYAITLNVAALPADRKSVV